jgi:UTP-glucose-1-phosphate uridylyltransferase/mevalonate kinase
MNNIQPLAVSNDKITLFVPGRLCLFGEHSDWAGQMRKFNSEIIPGRALVVCTEEGIYAEAQSSEILKISSFNNNGKIIAAEYAMELNILQTAAAEGGFFSYVAGVAAYMLNYHHIGGITLNCTKMTLPQKKGLSSSAAICTLAARAFNQIYGLNLTIRGEMEAAYGGEQLTPSRCGRLDQAVAYGQGIVQMVFDGDNLNVSPIKIGAPLYIVFADLNSKKDTVTILRDLNSAYPYPQTDGHKALHTLLGKINEKIVSNVRTAIAEGNTEQIGKLMTEAQQLFDTYAAPLSPIELQSPTLHKVLSNLDIKQWTSGGKGVGSQGDGTVQFIAKSETNVEQLKEYLKNTLKLDCYSITIPKTEAVRKAVIPLGGYGTRMYPATKSIKKEFLTIIDTDGLAKPALLVLLEQLHNSGIEEICLVIRPGEESLYTSLFEHLSEEMLHKFPKALRQYDEKLSVIRNKLTFAYQNEALGFGHAVLQSERFANGEPILVLLGDHLFTSNTDKSCISQLIHAYEKTEKLSIGLFELQLDKVANYGIAKIKSTTKEGLFQLSALIEKPTKELAEKELSHNGKYYGVFIYVITSQVYSALNQEFAKWDTQNGELQLTTALDEVTRKFGATGVALNGNRYDIGLPEEYRNTVVNFGK